MRQVGYLQGSYQDARSTKQKNLGTCVDKERKKISLSNEETRAICRSRDVITLMKVMLLHSVEYVACTQEARSADRALLGM